MPLRIGLLAYPLFVLVMLAGQRGAVSKYARAGSFSPQSARKPAALNADKVQIATAVKKGVMISLGDGRYYVDRLALRRQKKILYSAIAAVGLLLIACMFVLWPPW